MGRSAKCVKGSRSVEISVCRGVGGVLRDAPAGVYTPTCDCVAEWGHLSAGGRKRSVKDLARDRRCGARRYSPIMMLRIS